jgi:hypothetical protein
MSTLAVFEGTPIPRSVRAALAERNEGLAVQLAVGEGSRDANRLTDVLFRGRHPQRTTPLASSESGLIDEWQRIRAELVRPVLAVGPTSVPATLPAGARHGVTGPVSPGIAELEGILGRENVTNDYATRGHTATSWHYPGGAAGRTTAARSGSAVDFRPKRSLWDRLFPIRTQLHELYGPWGLYRDGRRFHDEALQRRHEHHIHVTYFGTATEIARLLGPVAPAQAVRPAAVPASSASGYFKDAPQLRTVPLAPTSPLAIDPRWPQRRRLLASTYNRIGGLIHALAQATRIEPAAVLAVWLTESAGRAHVRGKAVTRFENHLLYRTWGKSHEDVYSQHFRHGGYRGTPGRPWEGHAFRETPDGPWQQFHGQQDREDRALALARRLAGDDAALQCISIGGPQILVSFYRTLGYQSPRAMFDAWQADERAHVLGFFDLCARSATPAAGDLLRYLRERQFDAFARYYNGPGQVSTYAAWIRERYQEAQRLPLAR